MISLTKNAQRVLEARYLQKSDAGKIMETPEELFSRVAGAIAQAEKNWGGAKEVGFWKEEFLKMMTALEFLPNSPTLMNAGTSVGQLSACFVLPVPDSMEGIFETLKNMALVQRTGGGTGFSFSRLRPRGAFLHSTGGTASGPVSFMKIFDAATEHIKQGGRRRGANMGVLRVDHPDILEFIRCKKESGVLRNFNISVGITDSFLEAVRMKESYDLIDPQTQKRSGHLPAVEVFQEIIQAAWQTGDPGLIFLDTIALSNPLPHLGEIEATNPCGEIPLFPYESCNLGSINLARMLRLGSSKWEMDEEKLKTTVHKAVRFWMT